MSISFHPDISTLMAFSAGSLDEPYAVVVATHVAMCEACREQIKRIDIIGGALLVSEPTAPLAPHALDRLMSRLDDDVMEAERPAPAPQVRKDVPPTLSHYLPKGLDGVKWRFSGPGVAVAHLPSSANAAGRLMLLKVAGGRKVPEHSHGGQELTLILKGAYRDRFGVFAAGDIADHDEDVEHQPIAEPGEDCICLVAVDAPLSFRSRLVRALQPLVGL